jgi:hypothetical protein
LEGVPGSELDTPNVCGTWSVREIVAHLASFEPLLNEILTDFLDPGCIPTPLRDLVMAEQRRFNDEQVAMRHGRSLEVLLAEYDAAHQRSMTLIAQIPEARLRDTNEINWYYGGGYSMDDFLVYTYYGHKREHGAQIAVSKDALKNR